MINEIHNDLAIPNLNKLTVDLMEELDKITEKGKHNELTKTQLKKKFNRTKTIDIDK